MADLSLTDTQPMRSSFGGLYGGESHENVTVSQFNPKENIFHEPIFMQIIIFFALNCECKKKTNAESLKC